MDIANLTRCFIVGETSLAVRCAEICLAKGWIVLGIISPQIQVQDWARTQKIPYKSSLAEFKEEMEHASFDYLFSVANYQIIPLELLRLPKKLAINYHDALLPRFSGVNATSWAILEGEQVHGITWHVMNERVDAGDILKQVVIPVASDETALTLNLKCYQAATDALTELIDDFILGTYVPLPQNLQKRTWYGLNKKPKGNGLIKWDMPAEEIERMYRALHYGHYTNRLASTKILIGDQMFVVEKLSILPSSSKKTPGTVISIANNQLQVATSTKDILISGLKSMDDYVYDLKLGTQLPIPSQEFYDALQDEAETIAGYEAFWVEKLQDIHPSTLPFLSQTISTTTRPTVPVEVCKIEFSASLREKLYTRFQTKLEDLILTAWIIYLFRINRHKEEDETIDFYLNGIPFSLRLKDTMNFHAVLAASTEKCRQLAEKQSYLPDIYYRYPELENTPHCKLFIALQNDTLSILLEPNVLNSHLKVVLKNIQRHLTTLLNHVVSQPDTPISFLPLLTKVESQKILVKWNKTATDYPRDKTVTQLFEEQVEKMPDNIAVLYEETQLTYRELNKEANKLAHYLIKQGVQCNSPVAICMKRSHQSIISMLGILKAGGVYVPVDPNHPKARMEYVMQDSQAVLMLTEESLTQAADQIQKQSDLNPTSIGNGDSRIYIMYTSGTTGQPKGVEIRHRGVVRLVKNTNYINIHPQDRFGQVANFAFDTNVLEIWGSLLHGASFVIFAEETILELKTFSEKLKKYCLTDLWLPPALFNQLVEVVPDFADSIKRLILGGEALSPNMVRRFLQYRGREICLINGYGPTENSTFTTYYEVKEVSDQLASVPIGKFMSNNKGYILDRNLQPLPVGIPGELYIGGDGLSTGYLNKPEITQSKFITNPFNKEAEEKIYNTGDLVRWLPDGNIEYLGRTDKQIKIRGFRIELEAIQMQLVQHPSVSECIVIPHEDLKAGRYLAAYVIPKADSILEAKVLREFLMLTLPSYMIPTWFIPVLSFPLNRNGKIDYAGLPKPDMNRRSLETPYVAPMGELETQLAVIWAEILSVRQIGRNDNFFELGGTSLLVTRLIVKLKNSLNMDFALHAFLKNPTLARLASLLSGAVDIVEGNTWLIQDAILAPDIQSIEPTISFSQPPTSILLTGATGFLGTRLLHDLYHLTTAKLYCLVRAKNVEEAMARLPEALRDRVIPIVGDLSQPMLGLAPAQFEWLAGEIDSIYHNGAHVHHVYDYLALRKANALATQELLRLATLKRTKLFHYVSTFAALFDYRDASGRIMEGFVPPDILPDSKADGYAQSKWVSESLLTQAYQRGIPIKIYRPVGLLGNSEKGISPSDNHHLVLFVRNCLRMGYAPAWDAQINILPVDFMSEAIIRLSLDSHVQKGVFNIANPKPISWIKLIADIADALACSVELISPEDWRNMYYADIGADDVNFPLLASYLNQDYAQFNTQLSYVCTTETRTRLREIGMEYPQVTYIQMFGVQACV